MFLLCELTISQLTRLVDSAVLLHPTLPVEIVTHKQDDDLDRLVSWYSEHGVTVVVRAGESELDSLVRMATAQFLYISNSYMGFLSGLLSCGEQVYYPPNLMFGVFGLGSKYDASGWRPYDI
jgi:hypothetical protein